MIRIPVTMTPHVQSGKATGYYLLAQRLFTHKVDLGRRQFVGFSGSLVVTVGGIEHWGWDTLLKMAVNLPVLGDKPVNWLDKTAQYWYPGGFRTYIPGKVLKPKSVDEGSKHLFGEFEGIPVGDTTLYILRMPLIGGDVLLGRKELHDVEQ